MRRGNAFLSFMHETYRGEKRGGTMGREENLAVFQDTEHRCKMNQRLKEGIARSVAEQKLILEGDGVTEAFSRKALEKNRKTLRGNFMIFAFFRIPELEKKLLTC